MPSTLAAVAMLVVWAAGTFLFEAPGWIHLLLSGGVALLIWSVVHKAAPPKK